MAIDLTLRSVNARDAQEARDVLDKIRYALSTLEWPGDWTLKVTQEEVSDVH